MGNLNNKISIFIDKELKKLGKKELVKNRDRLIGKRVISYGVETSEIRRIAKKYFRQSQEKETERDWLKIIKELMSTKVFENQMAGILLLGIFIENGRKLTIPEIKKLIAEYIDNWATCDTMSSEAVARVIKNLPEEVRALYFFANSKNIWLRRTALVTVVKLKDKVEDWQKIAPKILSSFPNEKEPIVKKAVRWLERKVGKGN